MNLLAGVEGPGADAGGDEVGECGGVDRDALLVKVVQNRESLVELVLCGESLDVLVDGAWVLRVER